MFNNIMGSSGGAQLTAPSNLQLSAGVGTTGTLTWTNNEPLQQTLVYQSIDNAAYTLIATKAAGVASHDLSGLSTGSNYRFRVRHYDGSRYSGYSNTVSRDVEIPPPSGIGYSSLTSTTVTISWTNGDATANTVVSVYSGGGAGTGDFVANPGDTSIGLTGLTPETLYSVEIKHQKGSVDSDSGGGTSFTTSAPAPAGDPSDLTATETGSTTTSITWTNGDATADTVIERKTGAGSYSQVHSAGAGVTSWSDSGLVAGTTYTYRARHLKGSNYSSYSNEDSATTTAAPSLTSMSVSNAVIGNCSTTYARNDIAYAISGTTTGWTLDIEVDRNSTGYNLVDSIANPGASGSVQHTLFFETVDESFGDFNTFTYRASLTQSGVHATNSPQTDDLNIGLSDCP